MFRSRKRMLKLEDGGYNDTNINTNQLSLAQNTPALQATDWRKQNVVGWENDT